MNSITTTDPLTVIHTYADDKYFSKCSPDEFQKILEENKFIKLSLHWEKRIASSAVREFDNASADDYFKVMILPSLPYAERTRIEDSIQKAIENGVNITLTGILNRLEEIRKDLAMW
jgi:hypothetical protein